MKKDIHPECHEITVTCHCGHTFKTESAGAQKSLDIDVCSQCHPFYTGQQKIVDTEGRVDSFKRKYGG